MQSVNLPLNRSFRRFLQEDVFPMLKSQTCRKTSCLGTLVRFIYDNIMYAEFNTKSDYCHECGFEGEIIINADMGRECPQCHNTNQRKMNVTRRTCGYLGENFWNLGKTKEISKRVLHVS